MGTGIFLDVFPLDGTPDLAPARAAHSFYCYVLRKILYSESGCRSSRNIALRLWYSLLNLVPTSWVHKLLELSASKSAKKTEFVRVLTFPTPRGRTYGYPRKWFEHMHDIYFENRAFMCIHQASAFLEYNYGNYMELPPVALRKPSHPASSFQLPPSLNTDPKERD